MVLTSRLTHTKRSQIKQSLKSDQMTSKKDNTINNINKYDHSKEQDEEEYHPAISNIQREIWDDAYTSLCEDNPKLMSKFELIMRGEIYNKGNMKPHNNNDDEDFWMLMARFVQAESKKTKDLNAYLDKLDRGTRIAEGVRTMIEKPLQAVPNAGPPLAVIGLAMTLVTNPITERKANLSGLEYVCKQLSWYWELSRHLLLPPSPHHSSTHLLRQSLKHTITDFCAKLLLYQIQTVIILRRHTLTTILYDVIKVYDWNARIAEIKDAKAEVDSYMDRYRQIRDDAAAIKAEDMKCLQALGDGLPDPSNDVERVLAEKGGLLGDCCAWFFERQDFKGFLLGEDTSTTSATMTTKSHCRRVFWISGQAGKGKTMLFGEIVRRLQHQNSSKTKQEETNSNNNKVFYYFCESRNSGLPGYNSMALRGLIKAILLSQPDLLDHLKKSLERNDDVYYGVGAAITALSTLTCILRDVRMKGAIICIDALDECGDDLGHILDLITADEDIDVKWVITSRSQTSSVESKLIPTHDIIHLCLDTTEDSITNAVSIYVREKVTILAKGWNIKPKDQKMKKLESKLLARAQGTFLWVALACRELQQFPSTRGIEKELDRLPKGIYGLYDRMMSKILESKDFEDCIDLLSACFVSQRPITLTEFHMLVKSTKRRPTRQELQDWRNIVSRCGHFLQMSSSSFGTATTATNSTTIAAEQDEVLNFVHKSARDYLQERVPQVPRPGINRSIFFHSIEWMNSGILRRDMWAIGHPGGSKEGKKPQRDPLDSVAYACIFWAGHLTDDEGEKKDEQEELAKVEKSIREFLERHLLHWMEALSLRNALSEGARALVMLKSFATNHNMSELFTFLWEVQRFYLFFIEGIKDCPLQVYTSAMLFTPLTSPLRKIFKHQHPKWVKAINPPSYIPENWSACLLQMEDLPLSIKNIEYYPDGDKIVASSDGIVSVLDTTSGAHLRRFTPPSHVQDNNEYFRFVSMSRNGLKCACTSYKANTPVLVLDTLDGSWVQTTSPIADTVRHCLFSRDLQRMVTVSQSMIFTWDVTTGHLISERNLGSMTPVASQFLGDSTKIAIVNSQRHIEIIDTEPEEEQQQFVHVFPQETTTFELISFPHRWSNLISVEDDGEVYLWSTDDGDRTLICDGVVLSRSIAVSDSENMVASIGHATGLMVWTRDGGLRDLTPKGVINTGGEILFSPDDRLLILINNRTIWTMDTASLTWISQYQFEHHTVLWRFSPDTKFLASHSSGATQIWSVDIVKAANIENASSSSSSEEANSSSQLSKITACAFSKDGKWLSINSFGKPGIDIWRSSGQFEKNITVSDDHVMVSVFSWDCSRICIGTGWGSVQIHKLTAAATGENSSEPEKHIIPHTSAGQISSLTFSNNDKLLAVCSEHECIVYDITSNQAISRVPFREDFHSLRRLSSRSIALDDMYVAGAFHSGQGFIWSIQNATFVTTFQVPIIDNMPWTPPSISIVNAEEAEGNRHVEVYMSNMMCQKYEIPNSPDLLPVKDISNITTGENKMVSPEYTVDKAWILKDGKRIIWIPPQYRPNSKGVATGLDHIALFPEPRRCILLLEFSNDERAFYPFSSFKGNKEQKKYSKVAQLEFKWGF